MCLGQEEHINSIVHELIVNLKILPFCGSMVTFWREKNK